MPAADRPRRAAPKRRLDKFVYESGNEESSGLAVAKRGCVFRDQESAKLSTDQKHAEAASVLRAVLDDTDWAQCNVEALRELFATPNAQHVQGRPSVLHECLLLSTKRD
jgi:hypothetical protein